MSRAAVEQRHQRESDTRTAFERARDALARRVEIESLHANRLAIKMYGLDHGEPYVRDEFSDRYPPWQRIYVDVAGFALNYRAAAKDEVASFYRIARCNKCSHFVGRRASLETLAWEQREGYCAECETYVPTKWLRP
jgi:hypothetical protein